MLGTKNTLFINPSALRMSPIVVQDCPSKQTAIIFMSLAVPLWKRDHIWACWLLVVPHRRRDGKGHGRTVTSFSHSYQPVACSSYLIACNLRERLEWIGWGGLGRRLHLHGHKGVIIHTGHRPCSVAALMILMLPAIPFTHCSEKKPDKPNGSPELLLMDVYLSLSLGP